MKIIIVGATGYIGARLYKLVRALFPATIGTSSQQQKGLMQLDLKRPDLFDYELISSSDYILLTSAISAPDICIQQPCFARSINVLGTQKFIDAIIERGGRVIFFSSDTVYGQQETLRSS